MVSTALAGVALADGSTEETLSNQAHSSYVQSPPTGLFNLSDSDGTISGLNGSDRFGWSIATGDVNDDGHTDVLVGAPGNNSSGTNGGAAYLFYGPVDAEDLNTSNADVRFLGEANGDLAGLSVALGDVNADGAADVIVGAPLADSAGEDAGTAYVVFGPLANSSGTVTLGRVGAKLTGESAGDRAGLAVAARDVQSSETASLIVGAPGSNGTSTNGTAYLLNASELDDTTSLANATTILSGESVDDRAGTSVAWADDVNGDDRSELLVGAPRHNASAGPRSGIVYVVNGSESGERSLSSAAATLVGAKGGEHAGFAVASAGDVNGDNVSDLLIGAPYSDSRGTDTGAAYVVYGSEGLSGERNLSSADVTFEGESPGDYAGWAVSGGGDIDCDGRSDVVVGAPFHDTSQRDAGAAYLLYGRSTDDSLSVAKLVGERPDDLAGLALATDANVASNRADDVLISAPNDRNPQISGTVYRVDGGCDSLSTERGNPANDTRFSGSSTWNPSSPVSDHQNGATAAGASEDTSRNVLEREGFSGSDDLEAESSSSDSSADVTEPNDSGDGGTNDGDEADDGGDGARNGDGGRSDDGSGDGSDDGENPGDGGELDDDPSDGDGSDDGDSDDPRESTSYQRQGLHIYQNQCQHQSDGGQQQVQNQGLSATQNQPTGSISVLFQFQHVHVSQHQCQIQTGSNAQQTQRQFLLIRFMAQHERQDGIGDEQRQGGSVVSNQSQRQNQSDADQSQTQVQEFEVTFLYQRQNVPDSSAMDQWQSQYLHIEQRQSQVQGDGVSVSQLQYQRVRVVYQGQEQVTAGNENQNQSQSQSVTSAQQQRQNQTATNLTQAQNESITFVQNQSQQQNSTNVTQGQNQTLSVSQRQNQSQGDGDQVQSESQNVTASQNGTQDGGSNQTQSQTQSGRLAQNQSQSMNQTTGNGTSSQNTSAAVGQNQTQIQNGTDNDQRQNQSVVGRQSQSQTQNESESEPNSATSTASSSSEAASASLTNETTDTTYTRTATATTDSTTATTIDPTAKPEVESGTDDRSDSSVGDDESTTTTIDEATSARSADTTAASTVEAQTAEGDDSGAGESTTTHASSSDETTETQSIASGDKTKTAETETMSSDGVGEEQSGNEVSTSSETNDGTTVSTEASQ